jgi:tetratricopeptide (TPR) repeat protein
VIDASGEIRHVPDDDLRRCRAAPCHHRSTVTADDIGTCKQPASDGAIAACTRILALNPQDVVAYFRRGSAYAFRHDYDRAITDLDQAIQLDPKLAVAYSSRGAAYSAKGDYDRAVSDYDRAIQIDPKLAFV